MYGFSRALLFVSGLAVQHVVGVCIVPGHAGIAVVDVGQS
jgi:hypothetical protein